MLQIHSGSVATSSCQARCLRCLPLCTSRLCALSSAHAICDTTFCLKNVALCATSLGRRQWARSGAYVFAERSTGPLVEISKHLAGLSFADAPDYEFLHGCLHRLTDAQAKPRAAASGRSLMPALDGYPLPPHSLSGRTAAPASVAAGSHASLRAPDLIPSFLTFEAVNGHHLPDVGTIAPSSTLGAAPGAGLYPGGDANGVQPVFIADTPRSPPEESDLLYDDLPGVRSAPPPLSAESPPSATLPSPIIMMPVGKPSGQHADHRNEATQEAARQRGEWHTVLQRRDETA